MACSHIEGCELFVQFALNPALNIWQDKYCNGLYNDCARYKMSGAHQPVPVTLLPNGKMISSARSQEQFALTVLFNSITKHRTRMVQSIIRHTQGIDLNEVNVEGTSALMAAVEANAEDIVKLLLENNVKTDLKNMHGQTAYDLAVEHNHTNLISLLANKEGGSL